MMSKNAKAHDADEDDESDGDGLRQLAHSVGVSLPSSSSSSSSSVGVSLPPSEEPGKYDNMLRKIAHAYEPQGEGPVVRCAG